MLDVSCAMKNEAFRAPTHCSFSKDFRSLTKALAAELGRQQPDDSEHQGKRSFFR